MTARIVPIEGASVDVLARLSEVRAGGDVPLVGGGKTEALRDLIATARVPANTAWATITSGSSGNPRIVLRTADSWELSFPQVARLLGNAEEVLLPSPATSSLTLFSLAHSLAGGPRPSSTARTFHGTPQELREVLRTDVGRNLRTALVGGSHLDPSLRQAAEAQGVRVLSYYGAAELSFVAMDEGEGLRAFPGVDLDVRQGVLWVRSPYTALGYLGGPGPMRTDGGWTTVGDLASLDGGVLTLHGRADGAILTSSVTVVPEEIEAGLRTIPGISDAVVLGIPRASIGELVAAMVEPDEEAPSAGQLRVAAEAQFAHTHRPRLWFCGPIPRTASGKPARAEALRRIMAGEVARLG